MHSATVPPSFLLHLTLALLCFAVSTSSAQATDANEVRAFEQHVRPLLLGKCLPCHGPSKQEGGLRLDSRAAILRGGDSGPAAVPGNPHDSLLVQAVLRQDLEMPPEQELSEAEQAHLVDWIARDLVWPEHDPLIRPTARSITEEDRQWWAFQPVKKPPMPREPGSHHPIDAFVRARLAKQDMQPAREADRLTLVRRLYFNLLGVPPDQAAVESFVQDEREDAWGQLIDRLLLDRRYGEHWARHWLDVVRFAESDGWKADAFRPRIWMYRDYVTRSFNEDKPYSQFIREQLAGDEMPGDNPDQLIATGFLRLGIYEYNQRNARVHWNDIIDEITDVTADVFLGLGMACARCHDHKFDPVLQKDYYQLRAFFEPLLWRDDVHAATEAQRARHRDLTEVWNRETRDIRDRMTNLRRPYDERKWKATVAKFPLDIQDCFFKAAEHRNSWEAQMSYLVTRQFTEEGATPLKSMSKADKAAYDDLVELLKAHDDLKPASLPAVMGVSDYAGPTVDTVIPGSGVQVTPEILTVLQGVGDAISIEPTKSSSGRRTALAQWLSSDQNPLTARVVVNRVWQQHFGRGIVATANDFGRKGQRPTHPELLDWLTADFIEHGWSLKHLHKQILTSATWKQAAQHRQAAHYEALDPGNQLFWRARIRRLTAEQLRDAMLVVSGELQASMGGPSRPADAPCRSLYVKRFRNSPYAIFQAFDSANGLKSVPERISTTTPTQSLLMLNDQWVLSRAGQFAKRVVESGNAEETVARATMMAWGRPPTPAESESFETFLASNALEDLCHVLMNANEFLYVD